MKDDSNQFKTKVVRSRIIRHSRDLRKMHASFLWLPVIMTASWPLFLFLFGMPHVKGPHLRHSSSSPRPNLLSLPVTAVFFHIYVPKPGTGDASGSQERALNIVEEQLRQVGKALSVIPNLPRTHLYYTTVGLRLKEGYVEGICNEFSAHLQCHLRQHSDVGFEESTLTALHEYCVENEDHRAIYMHTKGSYHSSKEQDHWRQHMTNAITSRDCLERAHREGCDLCGLIALPQPTLHFTGNMFNAKCSYIRKLDKPKAFQRKMISVVSKAKELVEAGTLVANLLDMDAPWNVGLDRFAMEHWHGSHPSADFICDVATNYRSEYWEEIGMHDPTKENWEFGFFPRHPISAEWSHSNSHILIDQILNTESERMREYFLLPGQLIKWYHLYGEFPSRTSWVWSWYPDGQFWKRQVEQFGGKAVEIATRQWRFEGS